MTIDVHVSPLRVRFSLFLARSVGHVTSTWRAEWPALPIIETLTPSMLTGCRRRLTTAIRRAHEPLGHRGRMPWIDRADPTLWTSTPHLGSNFDSFDVEGYAIERGLLSVAEVQGFWGEIVCGEIDRLLTPPTSSWIRTHVRPDPTASIANNSTEGLS